MIAFIATLVGNLVLMLVSFIFGANAIYNPFVQLLVIVVECVITAVLLIYLLIPTQLVGSVSDLIFDIVFQVIIVPIIMQLIITLFLVRIQQSNPPEQDTKPKNLKDMCAEYSATSANEYAIIIPNFVLGMTYREVMQVVADLGKWVLQVLLYLLDSLACPYEIASVIDWVWEILNNNVLNSMKATISIQNVIGLLVGLLDAICSGYTIILSVDFKNLFENDILGDIGYGFVGGGPDIIALNPDGHLGIFECKGFAGTLLDPQSALTPKSSNWLPVDGYEGTLTYLLYCLNNGGWSKLQKYFPNANYLLDLYAMNSPELIDCFVVFGVLGPLQEVALSYEGFWSTFRAQCYPSTRVELAQYYISDWTIAGSAAIDIDP